MSFTEPPLTPVLQPCSEIKDRFFTTYGREAPKTAMAFAMNEDFSHVLSKQMDHWSDPRNDKISQMKKDIDDTVRSLIIRMLAHAHHHAPTSSYVRSQYTEKHHGAEHREGSRAR